MSYGFVITKDHTFSADLADICPDLSGKAFTCAGKFPARNVTAVRFALYDDDGQRYYEGKFSTNNPDGITEEETYDVLAWGMNYAGCTSMRFPGRRDLDIG